MSRYDPRSLILSPDGRVADELASLKARIAVLERGGGVGGLVGGPPSGAAGGELSGTYPSPTINPASTPNVTGLKVGNPFKWTLGLTGDDFILTDNVSSTTPIEVDIGDANGAGQVRFAAKQKSPGQSAVIFGYGSAANPWNPLGSAQIRRVGLNISNYAGGVNGRGLADNDVITDDTVASSGSTFWYKLSMISSIFDERGSLADYYSNIVTDAVGIKIQPSPTGITANGSLVQVNTIAAHGLTTGDSVIISGSHASANGTWTITVVDSDSFTLNTSTYSADSGGGKAAVAEYHESVNAVYRQTMAGASAGVSPGALGVYGGCVEASNELEIQSRAYVGQFNCSMISVTHSDWNNANLGSTSRWKQRGAVALWVTNPSTTRKAGTGLIITGRSGAGFARAMTLVTTGGPNTADNDLWCLDGLGNQGFGVTVGHTQDLTLTPPVYAPNLPAKIVFADDTVAAGGIQFGVTDPATLYRSAANVLKTDDSFVVGGSLAKLTLRLTDTGANTGMTIGGDTTLYRSEVAAVPYLKTDNRFEIGVNGGITTLVLSGTALGVGMSIGGDASLSRPAAGELQVSGPFNLLGDGGTFTSHIQALRIQSAFTLGASGRFTGFFGNGIITISDPTPTNQVYRFVATEHVLDYNNASNTTSGRQIFPFREATTISASGSGLWKGLDYRAIYLNPRLGSVSTGANTCTNFFGVWFDPQINDIDWTTVSNVFAVRVNNIGGGNLGTVTRAGGLYVEDITHTGVVTPLSVYSLGAAVQMQHAGPAVFGAAAAPTNTSVGLEVQSTTKAFLLPRMTNAQIAALTAVDGMLVYCTDAGALAIGAHQRVAGAWAAI